MEKYPVRKTNGNIWVGLLLLFLGAALLVQRLNLSLPYWLFSWKTLLITVGIFIGFRNGFRGIGWLIPILIGVIFLGEDFYPWLHWREYTWPIALIIVGLFLLIRPRNSWRNHKSWGAKSYIATEGNHYSNDDTVDHTAIFGSVEKTILSKDFKGGDLTTFCGGSILNLIQADINGRAILDVTQIFGGTKLIVPSHWQIKSEMVAVFGGIQDKRPVQATVNPEKVLVLSGTSVFGGIEIVSY